MEAFRSGVRVMRRDIVARLATPTLTVGLLCGTIACSAVPTKPSITSGSVKSAPANLENRVPDEMAQTGGNPSSPPAQTPQLIKTAGIRLSVRSIDQTLTEIRNIVKQSQGAIYNFDDLRGNQNDRRSASLEIKVPQANLDATLEAISKLGNVINTQVKSEDVTTQIVDTEARLKNLRQQEAMTQKIMERSGSVKDILAVSKELALVREQIERLDAQVKNLKSQVSLSTITLSLEEAVSGGSNREESLGWQVQDTWNRSTRSASALIRGLFLFGVGLIPFLPFLLLLGGGGYAIQRQLRRSRQNRQS
jgi:hypothetical protein